MSLTIGDGISSTRYSPPPPPPVVVTPPPVQQGDGSFSATVAGTQPQHDVDLQLAQMSNDSYSTSAGRPDDAQQSITELEAAGWNRLEPQGDHLVDASGTEIAIDPSMIEDESTGLRAAIFQNPEGQYVVAFAGTDTSQMPDIGADAQQAFGVDNQQYNQAIALAKEAEVAFGDGNVVFTGHSLGGGIASAAALATDSTAVTFNAAGLSNDTLSNLGLNPNAARQDVADSGQVRRYVVNSDPLTLAQQDLPIIPLLGGISPPDAVGTELRVAPMPGVTPVIGTHGGSGDGTSYVESVRNQTPYAPPDLSGTNGGLALSTLQNYGEYNFNQLGSLIDTGDRLVSGGLEVFDSTASNMSEVLATDFASGRYVDGTVTLAGDLADANFDLLGNSASALTHFGGESVENFTNFGGSLLRDLGERSGLTAPADAVAGALEGGGRLFSDGADAIGEGSQWLADTGGDGVEWGLDRIGDGGQAVTDGAQWLGDRTVEGTQWLGGQTVDGVQWLGGQAVDGFNATVDAVDTGADWVGDRASDAGDAFVDGASAVGSFLNPLD